MLGVVFDVFPLSVFKAFWWAVRNESVTLWQGHRPGLCGTAAPHSSWLFVPAFSSSSTPTFQPPQGLTAASEMTARWEECFYIWRSSVHYAKCIKVIASVRGLTFSSKRSMSSRSTMSSSSSPSAPSSEGLWTYRNVVSMIWIKQKCHTNLSLYRDENSTTSSTHPLSLADWRGHWAGRLCWSSGTKDSTGKTWIEPWSAHWASLSSWNSAGSSSPGRGRRCCRSSSPPLLDRPCPLV